jgi:acetyl-CoA acyltransferase
LSRVRPDTLLASVIAEAVSRFDLDPASIEDVIVGCAMPEGEQGLNIGRLAALMAGLPDAVPGSTINRFCGSSMQAIHIAAGNIAMGAGEVFLCAGVESMSRVPMAGFNPLPNPELAESNPGAYMAMGETAENVAERFGIGREDQDAFAVESQRKASEAITAGRLSEEVVAFDLPDISIVRDETPRPETTLAALGELAPAFVANGSVTAGTSSPLTDGAALTLVCSLGYATSHGLTPLARISAVSVAGCDPSLMGMGPVYATRKLLARTKRALADVDVIELNEAFASQSLACIAELDMDPARINMDGGAIALGHPLGATGARITGKAAQLLHRSQGRTALATQCIGGGQGIATLLESTE